MKRPASARLLPVLVGVFIAAAALAAWSRARRAQDRRLADLGACLFGEPLARGEKASARMLRIDLARPQPRMQRRAGAGKIEPEDTGPQWPETCAGVAEAANASLLLSRDESESLVRLAAALRDEAHDIGVTGKAAEEVWSHVDRASLPPSNAKAPWAPVALLPRSEDATSLPCDEYVSGHDEAVVVLGGRPGCSVTSAGTEQWSAVRARDPNDAPVAAPKLPDALAALRGPGARAMATCNAGATGVAAIDVSTDDPRRRELVVAFFDAQRVTSDPVHVAVTSRYDRAGGRELNASVATVSCRAGEAHVAWSWATSIDQKANDEIVVVTCTPGHCDTRTAVAHIDTPRVTNCGYCSPAPDELLPTAPTAVDLFGSVALLWNDSRTTRTRIGALEQLDGLVDTVLWHSPDRTLHFGEPRILTGGGVALVAVSHGSDPAETRLFRLDGAGPRELVMLVGP